MAVVMLEVLSCNKNTQKSMEASIPYKNLILTATVITAQLDIKHL